MNELNKIKVAMEISNSVARRHLLEFENMRNMAELHALSKVSLERPLTDREYSRMMELKNQVGL